MRGSPERFCAAQHQESRWCTTQLLYERTMKPQSALRVRTNVDLKKKSGYKIQTNNLTALIP